MSTKKKLAIAIAVVLAGIAYLAVLGFQSAKTYYLSVDQTVAQAERLGDRFLRVNGKVSPGTIDWEAKTVTLRFVMQGEETSLPVLYRGVKPDLLRDDVDVVVEGRLQEGVLVAERVLVKCPSKYEAAGQQARR
ncbi:MAG: cytochrome c biogenesis protein CcmE [Bacillota bacterium]|nr:MAG: cytochrome c biogenesis protein CcmE [Bacillota bacterium]